MTLTNRCLTRRRAIVPRPPARKLRLDLAAEAWLLAAMTLASPSGRPSRRTPRLARVAIGVGLAAFAALAAPALAQGAAEAPSSPGYAGSALKKRVFLSLKTDSVYLRQAPGRDQPTAWLLQRLGLPVEVVEQREDWSKVVDASGAAGWVDSILLSRRRTALIIPWEIKEGQATSAVATLREDDRESARAIAQVEAGVLASIIGCSAGWCRVSVGSYRGYIEQAKLWGTFPGEEIK
jgi:SH3-like domain-containing protein